MGKRHFTGYRPSDPTGRSGDIQRLRKVGPPLQVAALGFEQHRRHTIAHCRHAGPARGRNKRIVVGTIEYQCVQSFFTADRLENTAEFAVCGADNAHPVATERIEQRSQFVDPVVQPQPVL